MKAAREKRHGATLLACGLDRFHLINETFGHQAGDEILQEMATLLLRVVGSEARVSRIGGDHFALLVVHSDSNAVISDLLSRLRDILARPVLID
ncbi:MAG: GGDEF domain-containing protein [Pseudomonadota bacterium]